MDIIVRIFSYLKPYWKQVILLYGSLVLALSLQLLTPYVLGRAIDDGVIAKDTGFLLRAAGLIVGLTIFQGFFQYGRTYFSQTLAERVAYEQGGGLVEGLVTGRASAPQIVVIHARQVVMDQRVGVNQLDRRGRALQPFAAGAGQLPGGQDKQGAHPLAALQGRIAHGLV